MPFGILFFAKKIFYGTIKICESREEREIQWDGGFRNESILFCLGRPIIPFSSFFGVIR